MLPTLSRPPAPFSALTDRQTFSELGRGGAWGGLALLCHLGRRLQGRTGTGPASLDPSGPLLLRRDSNWSRD